MALKNDCQVDCIKEAFDKLYNRVMPYIDLNEFANADMAFKELDKKVHSEIHILKKCLSESDRAVDAGMARSKVLQERISDLEKELNHEHKHGEDLANANCKLASENVDLKARLTLFEHSRITWRARAQHAEKEVNTLKKNIHELEEENASLTENVDALVAENTDLHEKLSSDEKSIETLKKSNSILRGDNETLWSRLEEADLDISKRPWHGDGNAMTDEQASYKSLVEAIEFQGKRIEELEAEKARLKEAYDIHETTIKKHKENVDLSYGHEFESGDEVFVPWSCDPYMYIKSGQLYNPRTDKLVYVGKDQHLKWFGEKFAIV